MKSHQVYRVVAVALCLGIGGYVFFRVQDYYEARSWNIEIKVRTPVYETSAYPYGTQSPPNAIVWLPRGRFEARRARDGV